jgi:2',3'-cyclic-nucleotide 2'-phosphodiesterase (5'-nucleotidase family)
LITQTDLSAEEFYIIYTSNINGAIENCGCGTEPLGGLGRVKSVIDQFRKENTNVLLIDGGDYFNSYPYRSLNEAMYKALILMDYDCIVPGDQEFVEDKKFFYKYASTMKDKILLSNGGSEYNRKLEIFFGLNPVIIYGYLFPNAFDFIEKPDYLNLLNVEKTKPERATKNEFQIVILHSYFDTAEQFYVENNSIDLILLAHDQQRGVWNRNNSIIIGNGKDSEYISIIKIEKGSPWDITVKQQKISEDLPEDDQMTNLIKDYKKTNHN